VTPREREAKQQEKAAQQAGDEAAQAVKDETGIGEKPPSDPEQLREEIQEDREQLGDTVEALAQKADVKTQVQEKVDERKEQLRDVQEQLKSKVGETAEQAKQQPVALRAAAAGGVALLLLLWLIRRK